VAECRAVFPNGKTLWQFMEELKHNAAGVILRHFPWAKEEFAKRGWSLPQAIDRVYVIEKATKLLGYVPSYNFSQWFQPNRSAK
jgi:hypothetical protein